MKMEAIIIALAALIATGAGAPIDKAPGYPIGFPQHGPPPSIEKRLHLQGEGQWYTPSDPWQNAAGNPVYYDVPAWQQTTSAGDRPDDRSGGVPQYLGGILEGAA
ncbi:hypothetical protein EDD36DRAFT_421912 [Exophiala viscosa]|uniref:Uncharacterized protein n=1 Tax=Exophiala viscosa TaxID=2486360 RepID=A0AAN6I9P9_9EURO|nr:hypothetical protein EDD36DRAFT_421912 [Exophiala viscosa]